MRLARPRTPLLGRRNSDRSGPLPCKGALTPHASPSGAPQGILHMHKESPRSIAWGSDSLYGAFIASIRGMWLQPRASGCARYREGQTRRKAGAQSPRASYRELALGGSRVAEQRGGARESSALMGGGCRWPEKKMAFSTSWLEDWLMAPSREVRPLG